MRSSLSREGPHVASALLGPAKFDAGTDALLDFIETIVAIVDGAFYDWLTRMRHLKKPVAELNQKAWLGLANFRARNAKAAIVESDDRRHRSCCSTIACTSNG